MRPGQEVLLDPEQASAREWLLTNGLGGYSAGTAGGAPTKRTHGLLVSADLHGRQHLLLLQLIERATSDGVVTTLGHTLAAAGTPTSGTRATLEEFRLDPWPTWRYRAGETLVERTVFTLHRHHAIVVAYRHLGGPEARLGVSPLVVARAPGELQHERPDVRGVAQGVPGRVKIETFEGAGTLTLWHNGAFMPARLWQRGIVFPHDEQGSTEDAFVPGHVEGTLSPGRALYVVASAEDDLFRVLATEERLGVPPPKTLADCVAALDAGERDRLLRWRRGPIQGADFTRRRTAARTRRSRAGRSRWWTRAIRAWGRSRSRCAPGSRAAGCAPPCSRRCPSRTSREARRCVRSRRSWRCARSMRRATCCAATSSTSTRGWPPSGSTRTMEAPSTATRRLRCG
jgi:hypothetical protein